MSSIIIWLLTKHICQVYVYYTQYCKQAVANNYHVSLKGFRTLAWCIRFFFYTARSGVSVLPNCCIFYAPPCIIDKPLKNYFNKNPSVTYDFYQTITPIFFCFFFFCFQVVSIFLHISNEWWRIILFSSESGRGSILKSKNILSTFVIFTLTLFNF